MIISVLVRSYVAAMGSSEHSRATGEPGVGTTVFTDGACSGNPGPGGWAWIEPDGDWAAGYEADTTNQRMELTAVLRACERFEDPLHIVSDSTYVVNCWRDRWWQGVAEARLAKLAQGPGCQPGPVGAGRAPTSVIVRA
ncbi:MAG: hypothetical protein M5U19_05635 [Microthrixaceae bacterium]|nr:hypothetical protein [Microthrixaceae bacterium]